MLLSLNPQTHSHFALCFKNALYSKRIQLRVLSCFSFLYLLSVPECGPVPQSSLYFRYLDTFEDYKPITLYCVFWYAFVSCFPIIRFKLFILSSIEDGHLLGWPFDMLRLRRGTVLRRRSILCGLCLSEAAGGKEIKHETWNMKYYQSLQYHTILLFHHIFHV